MVKLIVTRMKCVQTDQLMNFRLEIPVHNHLLARSLISKLLRDGVECSSVMAGGSGGEPTIFTFTKLLEFAIEEVSDDHRAQ